jgi:sugar phosphate isomerase/epimerase
MRLGISSYTFSWAVGVPGREPASPVGPMELLDKAVQLGVRVVQVIDNLPLLGRPKGELLRFRQRADELGIQLEIGTSGISPEHLAEYLSLAQLLGSRIVRVLTDTAEHKPTVEEVEALLRQSLPAYEKAGVCIAVENHDRLPTKVLAGILERIRSPFLGICLDTVNSFGALEGPEVVVENLAPWVVNLHVKDFWIRRANYQMGFVIEGRPAGQGRLDVPWLLKRLKEAGRDPNAILELWTPEQDSLEATIAKEDAWARESIEYLRTLIPD